MSTLEFGVSVHTSSFPFGAILPHASALVRGEHGVEDAVVGEQFQSLGVHGGLRKPHAFRFALKTALKIGDPPADLRDFVAPGGQRHDDVVIDLGHRRAVAAKALPAAAVSVLNHAVGRAALSPPARRAAWGRS